MSFETYNSEKIKVIALLGKIQNTIGERQYVSQRIKAILEDKFTISVVGHFSTGKSSFLNVLMGFQEDILPENERASTSTVTILKSSQNENSNLKNMAVVHFRNGEEKTIDIKEIKNYTARNEEIEVDREICKVEIFVESEFLQKGIQIVDTPGINSIYTLEKDIIREQVQQSDACIYMFSYDKPGTDVEFKFLRYVNRYMGRIFFILNKIDLEDKSEQFNSVENTISELKNKMKQYGVEVDDKRLFPISVRLAKNGDFDKSGFKAFIEALGGYISGEDNTGDRLRMPLKYVHAKLSEEKEGVEERIIACTDNGKMLSWYIQERKQRIEKLDGETKQKRSNLKRAIEEEIRQGKQLVEKSADSIIEEVKDKLSEYTNELEVTLADFTDVTMEVYDAFLRQWEVVRSELHSALCSLIEENIDEEAEISTAKEKLSNIVYESLDMDKIDAAAPEFDFGRLRSIDKEIERARNDYFTTREKLARIRNDKTRENELKLEIERLKGEVMTLKKEKETRLEAIGEVTPQYRKENIIETVYRPGIMGRFVDSLTGPHIIKRSRMVIDDTLYKMNDQKKRQIEKRYSLELQLKEKRIHEYISRVASMGDVEYTYDAAKIELADSSKEYYEEVRKSNERKEKLEQMIIKLSINNYLSEINNICARYKIEAKRFLDNQQKLIVNVMMTIFKNDEEELVRLKEGLYDISELGNKTPEELQQELRAAYADRDKLIECIGEIDSLILPGGDTL